ncbi:uncharacterized protein SPAPADRAFT_51342 [Spathaspora passalidarum NRRL Y-27907]|uniref:Uncharacterized protein n=1 Tax=Spathaspora passalidarum (strain NRRL Y-27907 / 11-Y1) TaxID=619300 RepID=G3ARJ8_SPAPN|nr:uncharacterized protein SPAPADRAFT_51342 [Spathaspora passalidarum NRRL Y-27907]EGW31319.1 hypothetical protein SPAPADRAFT_51342 [Spathaspora passalidarum NRRL Y-27907]
MTPELVEYIIYTTMKDSERLPKTDNYDEDELDHPYFLAKRSLDLQVPYYRFLYEKIPLLHELVKTVPIPKLNTDGSLLHYYIWLSYHMNDLNVLEQLFEKHLTNLDIISINYILKGFIMNYQVEFAKSLVHKLIVTSTTVLPNSLFHSIVLNLRKADCLLENLNYVLLLWSNSPTCEPIAPKTLYFLLREFYEYGSAPEIRDLKRLVKKSGHAKYHLITSIMLQQEIKQRQPYNFKKHLTQDDFNLIERLCPTSSHKDIDEYYYSWMRFMVNYSNMNSIQFILKQLSRNSIPFTTKYFDSILQYYANGREFVPMIQFIESSMETVCYDLKYVEHIFRAFVGCYNYQAHNFATHLDHWIQSKYSNNLFPDWQLIKSKSQSTPYYLRHNLNRIKYDSKEWETFKKGDNRSEIENQIDFRVKDGFEEVYQRGVRPDFNLILQTFQFTPSLNYRLVLRDLLSKSQLLNERNSRTLEILSLQHPSLTKENLLNYFDANKDRLTSHQKIMFARMLINHHLCSEARFLFSTIEDDDLNDLSRMTILNFDIRGLIIEKDYNGIIDRLNEFPIDKISLSPYIVRQMMYLEKRITGKVKKKEIDNELLVEAEVCLKRIRGFIGDLSVRLRKDEEDIPKIIDKTFKILTKWMSHGK